MDKLNIKRATHLIFIGAIIYAISVLVNLTIVIPDDQTWKWIFSLFSIFAVAGLFVLVYSLGTIRKESKYFFTSFVFLIVEIIVHIVGLILVLVGYKGTGNESLVKTGGFILVAAHILSIVSTYEVIMGFKTFHIENKNNDLVGYANTTIIFFVCFTVGAGVLETIVRAVTLDTTLIVLFTVLDIALSIFAFVVYCIFLKKTEHSIVIEEKK